MPKYVVTMPGCCQYKVGDIVELSEDKAGKFVGKVSLLEATTESKAEAREAGSDVVEPEKDGVRPKRGRPRKA